MPPRIKEPAIWKLWGPEMILHNPKDPPTFLTCCRVIFLGVILIVSIDIFLQINETL